MTETVSPTPDRTPPTAAGRRPFLPARLKRSTGKLVALAATALFVGVTAYAYFTSTGSGTGTVAVGTLSAPVVSPPQSPDFNLTNMVGGDTAVQSVSVTVNGGLPTVMSLYEQTATGTLLPQLNVKIVEDGTTTVYNGPLATGWTASSPLALPGSGATGLWPAGESHTFVFTVSLPSSAGNSFQSASASVSFVWQRQQV